MKTLSTIRAPRLRASYRLASQNVLIAVALTAGAALYVVGGWYTTCQQDLRFTWWSLPSVCAVFGVLVVRALRRGVIVTDTALIVRRLLDTGVFPWRRFSSCRVTPVGSRRRMLLGTCDHQRVFVLTYDRDVLPLENAVDRATADVLGDVTADEADPNASPGAQTHDCTAVVAWVSAALLLIGLQVIESARYDGELYAARAARDVTGTAEVMDSHIDEDDSGEGSPTYTTVVDIRFVLGDRQVDTTIERPGRWKFPQELQIPIVYDSMHPRDADFGDWHNRRANDASVRTRLWVGPIVAGLAGVACIAFGFFAVRNAARSRGRTSRSLRQTAQGGRSDRGNEPSWPRV